MASDSEALLCRPIPKTSMFISIDRIHQLNASASQSPHQNPILIFLFAGFFRRWRGRRISLCTPTVGAHVRTESALPLISKVHPSATIRLPQIRSFDVFLAVYMSHDRVGVRV
ncbi:unnamed protein product [Musa banksii]